MTAENPAAADDTDTVIDDAVGHRFIIEADGQVAELVYRLDGKQLTLVHTGVPEKIGGRGIAGRLVAAAFGRAVAEGLTVVPLCPYVRSWLRDHPEAAGSVRSDWRD